MRKAYKSPSAEVIYFHYEDIITASGVGHFDSNGKWHSGGNGNKHVNGVNYDGSSNRNGIN